MDTRNWVININQRLANLPDPESESHLWKKRSIYKVPPCIVDLNKKAYHPHVVSFGPYHHGEDHLRPMEDHKPRALLHFLRRSGKPLGEYIDSLRDVVAILRECYDPLESPWRDDTEKFLKLMILDGCFMLEILRTVAQAPNGYAANDPIFSPHGKLYIIPFLRRDMLMIENQLPILLLERLVAVEGMKNAKEYVIRLILKLCQAVNVKQMGSILNCVHVLHVYRKTLLPRNAETTTSGPTDDHWNNLNMPSATKLREAGIRFRKVENGDLRDIDFAKGVLEVPVIDMDGSTESIFLNLMAFESQHVEAGNEVTSYVTLMDDLIDSDKDVALLRSEGIIQHFLGSDKKAANLINSLIKDKTPDFNPNLSHIREKVNKYCKKRRYRWIANLIHTNFRNPWSVLALIAAIFLFVLTTVQTTYTVLPYYQPGN